MVEEKKNVKKGPHQQKEKNMTNKHIDSDKQSGEDKKSIQVTRPISPTVLLVLQKKIKCKQCCACMRVKSKMRRGRPWMLVCENNACTSPKTELCSTEALAGAVHCEEDAKKSERRENILKNCFEENYWWLWEVEMMWWRDWKWWMLIENRGKHFDSVGPYALLKIWYRFYG